MEGLKVGLILGSAGLELSIKHTVVTLNMTPEYWRLCPGGN